MISRVKIWWWGYLDDQGNIHVKRYTDDRAIANCESMPFCKGIFEPFIADNAKHAKLKCYQHLKGERGVVWKK